MPEQSVDGTMGQEAEPDTCSQVSMLPRVYWNWKLYHSHEKDPHKSYIIPIYMETL